MTEDPLEAKGARDIVESLRRGEIPERGIQHYFVDRRDVMAAVSEDLQYTRESQIGFKTKYLRGHYGMGKSLVLSMIKEQALAGNFVVSYVVLDNKDCRFDKIEAIYRGVMSNLTTNNLVRGPLALAEVLGQWNKVYFKDQWASHMRRAFSITPTTALLGNVVMNYFLKPTFRSEILSWLMGVPHIPFNIKREFGVKGDLEGDMCMQFLSAFSRVIREAQYAGLVILFDEAESLTKLPFRRSVDTALEHVRIVDDNQKYLLRNTYIVYAGTYDFFEAVSTYPALQQRVKGGKSYRDPVIEIENLSPKDTLSMLSKVRDVYQIAYDSGSGHLPSDEEMRTIANSANSSPRDLIGALIMLTDSFSKK